MSVSLRYIKDKIEELYKDKDNTIYSLDHDDREYPMHLLYYQIYGKMGHMISLDGSYDYYLNPEKVEHKDRTFCDLDKRKTICNIVNYLNKNNIPYYLIRKWGNPFIFTINDEIIYDYMGDLNVICTKPELPEWIMSCVEKQDEEKSYKYVVYGQCGFETHNFKCKEMTEDNELNYNDDLPEERINNILTSEEPALIVLHGCPGTGKTSFIRNIINNPKYKNVLYLDQTCFNSLTDASFISLLTNNSNAIVILEDCEDLLTERDGRRTSHLSGLLNITDGIIGDAFNLKVICTFNMDLNKIDSALLRKGRLKLKYEFKPLTKDKVRKFFERVYPDETDIPDKEMTLAELYNYKEVNDLSSKKKRSVGF